MPIPVQNVIGRLPKLTSKQNCELSSLYEMIDKWIELQTWQYNTTRSYYFSYNVEGIFKEYLIRAYVDAGWKVQIMNTVSQCGIPEPQICGIILTIPEDPKLRAI